MTAEQLKEVSTHWQKSAADRLHYRLEHRLNLKLLIGSVGGEGCQQAFTVAVDAEHGGG